MAAITKRLLYLRPTFHSYARPTPCPQRFFSSPSDDGDDAPEFEQPPQTPSSFSSSLGAVRDSLQTQKRDLRQPLSGKSSFPPTPPTSRDGSTDDIRHKLSGFRSRYAPEPPTEAGGISLQDLYIRNQKPQGGSAATSGPGTRPLESISGSLSKLMPSGAANRRSQTPGSTPISSITENLKKKAPSTYFQKDLMGRGWNPDPAELGKKLKMMRPEKRKGKWFSLQELSDRLAKLKEAGHEESAKGLGSVYQEILGGIEKIGQDNDQNARTKSQRMMTLGVLGSAGAALADQKTGSPKNHLVEKYFHPDNMSSAEKMKLELAKVRDEFKMSESDCGSARVQVAQLTTKIKHLSTALHKKDKHSRKGLQAMVQQRKKLLKYLRRTDWDSYCLVLSKLGLRDNADIKA